MRFHNYSICSLRGNQTLTMMGKQTNKNTAQSAVESQHWCKSILEEAVNLPQEPLSSKI